MLPIEEVRDEVLAGYKGDGLRRMLVSAPTGSGKSTGLPGMLLDAGCEGLVVVVQPRRIAARMLAKRVADVRGTSLGGEVGYVVRYDRRMGESTRIVYVTDGILQRWLEENPVLDGIGAVVFDEFHERRLAMDVGLADCLNLQESTRVEGLGEYLQPCKKIEAGGRSYPVEIEYQKAAKQGAVKRGRSGNAEEAVWDKCLRALKEEIIGSRSEECGNVLIFMPGVYEIRRSIELIEALKEVRVGGWEVCALYGGLKPEMQDRAVRDGEGKRIIVSTNVAETSLTIPGVRTVIDGGLARQSVYDAVRGVDTLFVRKIARSAAEQRTGRAGRVAPGRCVRLWSEVDHGRRAEHELAEVMRVDLTDVVMRLKARGMNDVRNFRWLNAPENESLEHAEKLLEVLGALDETGAVSKLGMQLAKMPLHPRMARLLIAANEEGCLAEGIFAVTLIEGESLFVKSRGSSGREGFAYDSDGSDFCADWRGFVSAQAMKFQPSRCDAVGVMARACRELEKGMDALKKIVVRMGWDVEDVDFEGNARAFSRAILATYSDQLAVRNNQSNLSCRIVGGRGGQISADGIAKGGEYFITTEMTEVGGRDVVLHLNGCVLVDIEDVRAMYPKALVEVDGAVYDEKIRRVVKRRELRFRDLIMESVEGGEPCADRAAELLAERVASGELKLKKWDAAVEQWIARLLCLREWMPELELPGFDEEDRAIALEAVCAGSFGYKQIKDKEVWPALRSWLSDGQRAALDAYAPERITLYGVSESPKIAESALDKEGGVTVQVHICAPNQRPWQMTQDLGSFWKSGFAQMKKDLAGRYPKHDWSGGGHV